MRRRPAARAALLAVLVAGPLTAQPQATSPLASLAEERLAELAAREGKAAPRELLLRNLSRYFVLYVLPSQPEELARVLGTLERMMDRAGQEMVAAAAELAVARGAATIGREQVAAVLDRLLPATPDRWGQAVFFPHAPPDERVVVEAIDLQAFSDTALVWQRLLDLAAARAGAGESAPPLAPEAAAPLAQGLNAYGLLLLRLGGAAARAEHATELASHHLREAGRQLAARAASHAAAAGAGQQPPLDAPPGSLFRDVTTASGIAFRHVSAEWLSLFRRYGPVSPTFSGAGATAGDVDGDLWDDLILCGGAGCSLWRNRRDGTFEDATVASGINVPGEARMALLADFDNDGRRDLLVTYDAQGNRLFRALGGGRFEDVTTASGLAREGDLSGPAVAVDIDGDALLDLYVGNFGDYLAGENPWNPTDSTNGQPNRLFSNLGGLRFTEVTERAGVGNTGWTQALGAADVDLDGDQDLYIANDFGRNDLLLNRGEGTFESAGARTGSDDHFHGMNVAFADLNRDQLPDIFVTNIWFWSATKREVTETNTLLLSRRGPDGALAYERSADPALLARDTGWAWGAAFLDVEHDGDDDLFVANGFTDYLTFTQYRPAPDDPQRLYPINNGREPNHFFRNDGGLPNVVVEGSGGELPGLNSRGVALLDFDHDGDLDLAVSTFHAEAHLLRNDAPPAGSRWLAVDLVGDPAAGVNRDAYGAQLIARAGDLYVWRNLTGGDGYLSQSTRLLHLGLGAADSVDLEVVWPGGRRQAVAGVAANQRIRIHQGRDGFEVLAPAAP